MRKDDEVGASPELTGEIRRDITLRLTVIARLMRGLFDRHFSGMHITRSQWSMIIAVARRPGSTQRMIADMMEMSEASAGRLIDRLCMEGLLKRQERDDDRRARAVYVTDKAEPLLTSLSELAQENEKRLFRGFSDEELVQLEGFLDRLYHNAAP